MRPITLALAGDTMLGRGVAARLEAGTEPEALFAPELVEIAGSADLFVLNLECCISDRGEPWPDPDKPFFFRAPPIAARALGHLGVDCVTLANNHALDFGTDALLDTLDHLSAAGIRAVGAGPDAAAAWAPVILEVGETRLGVIGLTDHPVDYAASPDRPGVAFVDLHGGVPRRLTELITRTREQVDALLMTPHWGPNMAAAPVGHVRRALPAMLASGATLVAGHSAHVFQGVAPGVLYDLGDFIDDYVVDPILRNDLGLLWLLELDGGGPVRLEAVPLRLELAYTRLADEADAAWIARRFRDACRPLGTDVAVEDGRLTIEWRRGQRREVEVAR